MLRALGIDEDNARARALLIGKELMGAAEPEAEEDNEDGSYKNDIFD